jgi:hypothetical protein
MLTNYVRHAGYGLTKSGQAFLVDTAAMATRARVQKGIDSVASIAGSGFTGSGTTNYVAKFTGTKALGNSQIFDDGDKVRIGTTTAGDAQKLIVQGIENVISEVRGTLTSGGTTFSAFGIASYDGSAVSRGTILAELANSYTNPLYLGGNLPNSSVLGGYKSGGLSLIAAHGSGAIRFYSGGESGSSERMRIFSNGNIGIGTTTDAGYKTDIAGTLRSTLGANFATTSGNVGIGTASPSEKLHVSSTGDVKNLIETTSSGTNANAAIFLKSATEGHWAMQTGNAVSSGLRFYDVGAGAERARFNSSGELLIGTTTDAGAYALQVAGSIYNTTGAVLAASSGNVGIGTASPSAKLENYTSVGTKPTLGDISENYAIISGDSRTGTTSVSGNYAATLVLASNTNTFAANSGASLSFHSKWNSALYTSSAQFASIFGGKENGTDANLAGYLSFATRPSGGNPTERMRITSDGELLLNTTTDVGDYKLQINGNERIAGKLDVITTTEYGVNLGRSGTSATGFQAYNSTAAMVVGIESSAGGGLFTGTSAYAAVFGNANNYPAQFITNNAVRATITASGNLLIGTATDNGLGYKLQVNGGIYANNTIQAKAAQVSIDSVNNLSALYISQHSITGSSTQPMMQSDVTLNTTGDVNLVNYTITNTASGANTNWLRFSDGSNIFRVTKAAEVVTAAPTGGSIRKWKLGEAATVSPTSPNRTIRVEIDGTVYYLHAKTTND